MHRTTILLPPELHREAERTARAQGISLSELIRRRLTETVGRSPRRPRFFSRQPWTGSGPSDVALEHDRHLYGE